MQKLILKFGLLGIIMMGIFSLLDAWYDRYYQQNLDLCDKALWVLSLEGESYQDAFIGSSRVFNMLDIKTYSRESKRSAINLATSGSGYGENYLLLQQFLAKENKIDRLFIQTDIYGLDSKAAYNHSFHAYKYLPWLEMEDIQVVIKDHVPAYQFWMWRLIPFVKYMEFNSQYDFYKTLRGGFLCTESSFSEQQGSLLLDEHSFVDKRMKEAQDYSFNQLDWTYMEKLVSLAEQQEIEVIFYQAPEYSPYLAHQQNREELLAHYQELATTHAIPFYRFESWQGCDDQSFFSDFTHLNKTGTTQFTRMLVSALKRDPAS